MTQSQFKKGTADLNSEFPSFILLVAQRLKEPAWPLRRGEEDSFFFKSISTKENANRMVLDFNFGRKINFIR